MRGPNDANREQTARRVYTARARKKREVAIERKQTIEVEIEREKKHVRGEDMRGLGWEKEGNGARYGEMARKPGIVTGNGLLPTPEPKTRTTSSIRGRSATAASYIKPSNSSGFSFPFKHLAFLKFISRSDAFSLIFRYL